MSVPDAERALFARLDALGIRTATVRHPPVATVAEAKRHRADLPGVHLKNLFLRDKRERQWLLSVPEDRVLDLRALRPVLGSRGNPTFGSPERLQRALGVAPGSVTPFAAQHDVDGHVTVVLDAALRRAERLCCHPLHNEATTTIAPDLVRFLRDTGHVPAWIQLDPLVRPGTLSDVDALTPLAPSFPGEPAEAFLRRILAGIDEHPEERALFVAERDGRVVGYSRVGWFSPPPDAPPEMVPEGWLLAGIVVDPAYRRQGIGRALTEARLDWLDARGGPAHYWTDVDNVASIALHSAYGFEPIGRDFVFVKPHRDDAPRTLYRRAPAAL
jgi:Ala-tRNA(Pro) deacylase